MLLLLEIRRRARVMLGPLIGACIAFYFGYHAVHGDRGIYALMQLDKQIEQARAVLEEEASKRAVLERRVSLLRPDHLDPDMLEERARLLLNFGRPDDVVILQASPEPSRSKPVRITDPRVN